MSDSCASSMQWMEWRKNRALKVERGHLDVVYVAFVVVEDAGVLEREAVHVRAA